MNLAEYARYDALGLAELVARKEVTPKELALTAVAAHEKVDSIVNAVVELYPTESTASTRRASAAVPSAVCRFSSRTCSATRRAARSSSARACARA
jgi:hypothetical protein